MATKRGYLEGLKSGVVNKNSKVYKDQSIKDNIEILDELKGLILPLASLEFDQLERNILQEGCRDPLVIWQYKGRYVLVDGHNRYNICRKNKLDFKVITKPFKNLDAVKDWMINNQLGRRNVTPEQASYLRGLQYNREKQKKGGYGNVEKGREKSKGQNDSSIKTSEMLASQHNVSEKTIQRDAKFTSGLEKLGKENKKLKEDILTGRLKVKKENIQSLARLSSIPKVASVEEAIDLLKSITAKKATSGKGKIFPKTVETAFRKLENWKSGKLTNDQVKEVLLKLVERK